MSETSDSTEATARFGSCAEAYLSARPSYPETLCDLVSELLLGGPSPRRHVVDLGGGTGLFTTLLADLGVQVTAVEPNDAMRRALERAMEGRSNVTIRLGTAEATGIPDKSVDLLTAAQAFHWFDPDATRTEATRILRPTGNSLFVWNTRRTDTPPMAELDVLLRRFARDYDAIAHTGAMRLEALARYALARAIRHRAVPHVQRMTRDTFHAWLMSISYLPRAPDVPAMRLMAAMDDWFGRHCVEEVVTIHYSTDAYAISEDEH